MRNIFKSKIFRSISLLFLAGLGGFFNAKLSNIQFILENADINSLQGLINTEILPNIHIIKIAGVIITGMAIGLHISYNFTMNNRKFRSK